MQPTITREQRQAAKRQLIEQIAQGTSLRQVRAVADVLMRRTTVYRLLKRVRTEGETAFSDGRHGHPIKLRGEVRTFLIDLCQQAPSTPSSVVQAALQERFLLAISVSQLNRVRAALGLSSRCIPREKKPEASTSNEPEQQESAGSLLLLAAATETGLLTHFSQALPPEIIPYCSSHLSNGLSTHHRLLLTLLFLGAVGLSRTWDLRGYTGEGLALLTGRKRAYGYRYTEEFLAHIAQVGGADLLTDALACWTAHLWQTSYTSKEASRSAFYVDGHHKSSVRGDASTLWPAPDVFITPSSSGLEAKASPTNPDRDEEGKMSKVKGER